MKTYSYIVWVLILICCVIAGYGTAIRYCFIGGIVQLIDSIKATPTDSWGIAYGLARFLCTGIVIAITTGILIFLGGFTGVITPRRNTRRRW